MRTLDERHISGLGKESLKKSVDPEFADLLRRFMSDLSEEYYCAGWLIGLEYSLWNMLEGGSRRFGLGEVTDEELRDLWALYQQAGGWWTWYDSEDPDTMGEVFVTVEEWNEMYQLYKNPQLSHLITTKSDENEEEK